MLIRSYFSVKQPISGRRTARILDGGLHQAIDCQPERCAQFGYLCVDRGKRGIPIEQPELDFFYLSIWFRNHNAMLSGSDFLIRCDDVVSLEGKVPVDLFRSKNIAIRSRFRTIRLFVIVCTDVSPRQVFDRIFSTYV